ncbi:hypothetical protein CBL_08134 [Carabus blaptoides fortunei]
MSSKLNDCISAAPRTYRVVFKATAGITSEVIVSAKTMCKRTGALKTHCYATVGAGAAKNNFSGEKSGDGASVVELRGRHHRLQEVCTSSYIFIVIIIVVSGHLKRRE